MFRRACPPISNDNALLILGYGVEDDSTTERLHAAVYLAFEESSLAEDENGETTPAYEIGAIAVDQRSRRSGLGAEALREALRAAQRTTEDNGLTDADPMVMAKIDIDNEASQGLFRRFGFVPVDKVSERLFLWMAPNAQTALDAWTASVSGDPGSMT